MKLTIRDVAKLAGVSPTAVSFVINGKGNISQETRRRVEQIIEQTGFRPSINSRRLSYHKSFNICVVLNTNSSLFNDMFYLGVTRGVQQEARALGYNVVLADFSGGTPEIILNCDTDGAIFFQDLDPDLFNIVRELSVPIVVADSHMARAPYSTVGVDNQLASQRAVGYLLGAGHRDIALLGPSDQPNLYESALNGYTAAYLEMGLIPPAGRTARSANSSTQAGGAMAELLSRKPWPTAVFCPGDRIAIGAMLHAQDMGARVPEDISFISIDDTLLCRYVRPMLTTVHIDTEALGANAMRVLRQLIDGGRGSNMVLKMEEIVERDSVRRL